MNFPPGKTLEIETSSLCNRRCPTCIRNSCPDKEATAPWFENNKMPTETILNLVRDSMALGFNGVVCLSHYNEPLYDDRLVELGREIKKMGEFGGIFFHSNGDLLTEEMAAELDGVFDEIDFTIYDSNLQDIHNKQAWITSLFQETEIVFCDSKHSITHFSPTANVEELSNRNINRPCFEPLYRIIFNHKGELLFCCDEVFGNFDLGSYPDKPIEELWLGEKYQSLMEAVSKPGGRRKLPYCSTCPRG